MKLLQKISLYSFAELFFSLLAELEATPNDNNKQNVSKLYCPGPNAPMNFTDFDNSMGMENGCYIVPNYLHYVRFAGEVISYLQMICILSAFQKQKPEKIFIYYDNATTFTGRYWETLKSYPGFMDVVELIETEMVKEIFGQDITKGFHVAIQGDERIGHWVFHASDITRIRKLMKYGGIFLDNDVFLVKPIHEFRRFEMALGWDNTWNVMGTQVLLAHKDARFLKLWLESYRGNYKQDEWYYNAGYRPSLEMLPKNPSLIHAVNYTLGNDNWSYQLYTQKWMDWNKHFYAIHILARSRKYLLDYDIVKIMNLPDVFNDTNILNYDITLREMCLSVYNPTNFSIY